MTYIPVKVTEKGKVPDAVNKIEGKEKTEEKENAGAEDSLLAKLMGRFDNIDNSFARFDTKFDDLNSKLDTMNSRIDENSERITKNVLEIEAIKINHSNLVEEVSQTKENLESMEERIANKLKTELVQPSLETTGMNIDELNSMIKSHISAALDEIRRELLEKENKEKEHSKTSGNGATEAVATVGEREKPKSYSETISKVDRQNQQQRTLKGSYGGKPRHDPRIDWNKQVNDIFSIKTSIASLFSDAKQRVGVFPVTWEDIKFFSGLNNHPTLDSDSPTKFCYAPEYHQERMMVGRDFIHHALEIQFQSIPTITDAKMCLDKDARILWLDINEDFIRKMFMASARI